MGEGPRRHETTKNPPPALNHTYLNSPLTCPLPKIPHLHVHPHNVPLCRPIDGVKSSTIPLLIFPGQHQLRHLGLRVVRRPTSLCLGRLQRLQQRLAWHLRCIAASKEPQALRTAHGCRYVGKRRWNGRSSDPRTPPGLAPASQPHPNQVPRCVQLSLRPRALLPLQLSLPHPVPSAHRRRGFRPTDKR
ncbi:hypothetical protein BKA70DRAFT_884794 [Coprinopsis sp. MPI-PUGE-AT-0042]|nr:hypothetical protein BKA70DRAFT_884794 [Coprinopsis sp. MPI-PUGE-AT-0042]